MKLRKPRLTNEKLIRIATDYRSGMKVKEIRKRHKCGTHTIYKAINLEIGGDNS